MPKEYVESINYEYNKADGQTYINVNVVRPAEKSKNEALIVKTSKTKSSLKAPTGPTGPAGPTLSQQQREQILLQQQQQQIQQEEILRQQQYQIEQQQRELEQQQLEQQQRELEQEQAEQQETPVEQQKPSHSIQSVQTVQHGLSRRSINEELLKIELRKLELKELELRRKEIRDLESRRNELIRTITAVKPISIHRRGYSQDVARTISESSSRPSSSASFHQTQHQSLHQSRHQSHHQSRHQSDHQSNHQSNQQSNHRTVDRSHQSVHPSQVQNNITNVQTQKVATQRTVPNLSTSTARPQAPSNYQNGSALQSQQATRTIAQVPPPRDPELATTIAEGLKTENLPTSTQLARELGLPTASQWLRGVQQEAGGHWYNQTAGFSPYGAQQQQYGGFGLAATQNPYDLSQLGVNQLLGQSNPLFQQSQFFQSTPQLYF